MTKAYQGGCHCGAVRYEVTLVEPFKALECNCSICKKAGFSLAFANASTFTLRQGKDSLSDYQFGKKRLHHYFCKTCGVRSFSEGTDKTGAQSFAVNLRCIDGLDLGSIEVRKYDGASA